MRPLGAILAVIGLALLLSGPGASVFFPFSPILAGVVVVLGAGFMVAGFVLMDKAKK